MDSIKFSLEEARAIGTKIGIDWSTAAFTPEEFLMGLHVELEHGSRNPKTNVTNDDPLLTGKVAWAHLEEMSDYYQRLSKMENENK